MWPRELIGGSEEARGGSEEAPRRPEEALRPFFFGDSFKKQIAKIACGMNSA